MMKCGCVRKNHGTLIPEVCRTSCSFHGCSCIQRQESVGNVQITKKNLES